MRKGRIYGTDTHKTLGYCHPIIDCGSNYYAMLSNDAAHGVNPSLDDDVALGNDATHGNDATLSNYALLGGNVSCTIYYIHHLEAHHHDTKQHVTKLCNMYHDGDI
jgi:hypothetical protein